MIPAALRRLREFPPGEWPGRAAERARREGADAWRRLADRLRPSYESAAPGPLLRILPAPPLEALRPHAPEFAAACARDLAHEFDLLGSGPVVVRHGAEAPGVEGWRYPSAPRPGPRIDRANRRESDRIRALLPAGYQPIDWQLDFRSGFRLDESTWWRDVPVGHLPGVDVKVPWELSRMQHLPRLACAHALAAAGEPGFEAPGRYAEEFRGQLLDWIAANPPRWGVNWRMPMDAALRVASWLAAWDLFAAQGVRFDAAFAELFRRSVREHALHLVAHLEWNREVRGNHYLADVAGLLFCAAWLPRTPQTDAWLAWSVQELGAETALQFTPDGAGFEASTAYHCLAMEMVAWATALVRGLPPEKARALREARTRDWKRHPPLRPNPSLPGDHDLRVRRMVEFAAALVRPGGEMARIGDDDSGRFLPLRPGAPAPAEQAAVAAALCGPADPREPAAALVAAWIGPQPAVALPAAPDVRIVAAAPEEPGEPDDVASCEILLPGGGARRDLRLWAFPDFGVYVLRSARLWIAVRCGGRGQIALAGHAHEDQLAVELAIDGADVVIDPGSYLYTALPEARERYRSAAAHWTPRTEPPLRLARRGPTLFELHDRALARCLRWDGTGFAGLLEAGGVRVRRKITVEDDVLRVVDSVRGPGHRVLSPFPEPTVEASPVYGVREPEGTAARRLARLMPVGPGRWEWRR
ncbi:MAG TPA: heparinase II/III family protein [Longimicrobiaceae bacterium]